MFIWVFSVTEAKSSINLRYDSIEIALNQFFFHYKIINFKFQIFQKKQCTFSLFSSLFQILLNGEILFFTIQKEIIIDLRFNFCVILFECLSLI